MNDLYIEVVSGTSVRLLTKGKYCDKNIVITALGSLIGYRYIRFIINALRGDAPITQLSELQFIDSSNNVYAYPSSTTVTTNIPNKYPDEEADKVIDGSTDTKFCSGSYATGSYLQIDLGANGRIDPSVYSRFRWYTANDVPERDPVSFEVRFSNDGINFDVGIAVMGATITTERYALAYTGNCIEVGRLPSGYTELEYIESNGTQYIDAGFVPNQDTRVYAECVLAASSSTNALFGCRVSSNSRQYQFVTQGGSYRTDYNTTAVNFAFNDYGTEKFYVDKNKNVTDLNGDTTYTHNYATFTCPGNMYIFATNNNDALYACATAKLYCMKVYDNDTLVRDFVPCINPNGEYGLYDLVNAEFYGNSGSGVFTGARK